MSDKANTEKLPNFQIAKYESRMRPDWVTPGEGWHNWEQCSQGSFEDILKLPRVDDKIVYNNWQYDVRVLWVDVNNPQQTT